MRFKSIANRLATLLGMFALAGHAFGGNVNVTTLLNYVQGTGGVYHYSLTVTNLGPEAVDNFWCGWIPGVFNIAGAANAGNSLGWGSTPVSASIQYSGSAGTALGAGSNAVFTFDSTSTPAQFQSQAAGESWIYGVNYSPAFGTTVNTDMEQFFLTMATPPALPDITQQPTNETVITNSSVTFDVTATNATSYQWESNTVVIPGATNSSFVLSNVTVSDSASYQVVVSNTAGPIISSNAVLTVVTILITSQPQSQTVATNTNVTFTVTAPGATFYQWESNLVDIPGATNSSLGLSNVVAADSASYLVVVSNTMAALTSSVAVLVVGSEPVITQQPSNFDVPAGTPVTFQVVATGTPSPVYQWSLNGHALPDQTNDQLALGGVVADLAGTYTVTVSNVFGQVASSNAVLTVEPLTTVTKEKLTVTISPPGSGSVSPNDNNKSLIVAHTYTFTANPAKGQVFNNWSGAADSEDRTLAFVMPSGSNVVLTANFVPSPFASNGVAGVYAGLFWDTNHPSNATSGFFTGTVAATGLISGQVKLAGLNLPFSTTLHADGRATLELKRHNLSTLVLTLQVDLSGTESLTGTVSDTSNSFNAPLTAVRAGFSAKARTTAFNGFYTWNLSGAESNGPAGFSYGSATVAPAGGVTLAVNLSDGTTTTASGSVSTNGEVPLYVSLQNGKGSVLAWLTLTNARALSTNAAYWFKDATAKQPYPNGFTLTNLSLVEGLFVPEPHGIDALNTNQVSVQFTGGDLVSSNSQTISLNASGVGGTSATVTLNIADKTGLFTGTFHDPVSGKVVHFKGAVVQPAAAGYGYFLSDDLSGAVLVQP